MQFEQIIGILAGLFTTLAVLPQIIKALKTKSVDDVSPIMFITLCIGLGLWTVYGFLKEDLPIIITNGISFILNSFMLILSITSRSKSKNF
ncbi:hypothetical protein Aeqsu_3125 [Aequorivita sublithincola DSM 14238]|uniref:MtN3 and saliva related transmembrane protein n=1 Tax=Aequorivita sublithincola (strain DSM 14238 / LMG 21431 / ACAM 643 / 9-3) TaxID=746697 RepID=I3YZZ2_AEQSU|nr:SemiSWEET transporter [Aequorivita sublithincola]AFL82560.1 hypothetical protein Aeqsu_3125 [Aequorivita sublithincola DSM 14238]